MFRSAASFLLTALLAVAVFTPATTASAQEVKKEFPRPRIVGLSHAAFYVNDLAKARAFYKDFFGFDEVFSIPRKNGGELVWIKINDRQTIELFPGAEVAPDTDRLFHIALEVEDAEAMRLYLQSKGVAVPAATPIGKIGNRNYFVKDPAGNTVEIVQYMPDGWTVRERGKHLPDTRISQRMSHVGVMIGELDASLKFYGEILGFKETWRGSKGGKVLNWVNLQVPDGKDYIEFMLYDKYPSPERVHTLQHICLEVADVAQTSAILKTRKLPEGLKPPTEIATGVNGRRQINYYDPDGTRVEVMEPTTADGKPVPSSTAPVPHGELKPAPATPAPAAAKGEAAK